MNVICLTGRFTKDPEVRQSGETKTAKFGLAVNRRFKREGQSDADFFNCTAFGKTAEFVEKYFHKGMKADVSGRMENNNWTDQNGTKHYDFNVIVDNIEFGESRTASGNNSSAPTQSAPTAAAGQESFMQVPDSDLSELPFS